MARRGPNLAECLSPGTVPKENLSCTETLSPHPGVGGLPLLPQRYRDGSRHKRDELSAGDNDNDNGGGGGDYYYYLGD